MNTLRSGWFLAMLIFTTACWGYAPNDTEISLDASQRVFEGTLDDEPVDWTVTALSGACDGYPIDFFQAGGIWEGEGTQWYWSTFWDSNFIGPLANGSATTTSFETKHPNTAVPNAQNGVVRSLVGKYNFQAHIMRQNLTYASSSVNIYTMFMAVTAPLNISEDYGILIPKRKYTDFSIRIAGKPETSGKWWLTFPDDQVQILQEVTDETGSHWEEMLSDWENRQAIDFADENPDYITIPMKIRAFDTTPASALKGMVIRAAFSPDEYVDQDPLQFYYEMSIDGTVIDPHLTAYSYDQQADDEGDGLELDSEDDGPNEPIGFEHMGPQGPGLILSSNNDWDERGANQHAKEDFDITTEAIDPELDPDLRRVTWTMDMNAALHGQVEIDIPAGLQLWENTGETYVLAEDGAIYQVAGGDELEFYLEASAVSAAWEHALAATVTIVNENELDYFTIEDNIDLTVQNVNLVIDDVGERDEYTNGDADLPGVYIKKGEWTDAGMSIIGGISDPLLLKGQWKFELNGMEARTTDTPSQPIDDDTSVSEPQPFPISYSLQIKCDTTTEIEFVGVYVPYFVSEGDYQGSQQKQALVDRVTLKPLVVDLEVDGTAEEDEEDPGIFIPKGKKCDAEFTLGGINTTGHWKLSFPVNIKVWIEDPVGTFTEVTSDFDLGEISVDYLNDKLRIEGVYAGSCDIVAIFLPDGSSQMLTDTVHITVFSVAAITLDKTEILSGALDNIYHQCVAIIQVSPALSSLPITVELIDRTGAIDQNASLETTIAALDPTSGNILARITGNTDVDGILSVTITSSTTAIMENDGLQISAWPEDGNPVYALTADISVVLLDNTFVNPQQ